MYAVVETGGKQYKVAPGQVIDVERLPVEQGNRVELDRVLLIADSGHRIDMGEYRNGFRVHPHVGRARPGGSELCADLPSNRFPSESSIPRYGFLHILW